MSKLTELLKYHMQRKRISGAELARHCGSDRGSMNQILKDKRRLTDDNIFEQILDFLRLSPKEQDELTEAYKISKMGEDVYYRNEAVSGFLGSLSGIYKQPQASKFNVNIDTDSVLNSADSPEAVSQMAIDVMSRAVKNGGKIKISIPPSFMFQLNSLMLTINEKNDVEIEHILCYDNAGTLEAFQQNLECTRCILRCTARTDVYKPYYYYASVQERFDKMSLLPFAIITDNEAMLISEDNSRAIRLSDGGQMAMLNDMFDKMREQCQNACVVANDGVESIALGSDIFFGGVQDQEEIRITKDITPTFCINQVIAPEMIHRYINPDIPNFDETCKALEEYVKRFQKAYTNEQPYTQVCDYEYTQVFFREGRMLEYPPNLVRCNLEVEDRRIIFQRLLDAIENGVMEIILLRPGVRVLDCHWQVCIYHKWLYLLSVYGNHYRGVNIKEPITVSATSKYIDSLIADSDKCMSREESIQQLKDWAEECFR